MGDVRLFSLALMHIHYDKAIEVDEVVKLFCEKQSRRMKFVTVPK